MQIALTLLALAVVLAGCGPGYQVVQLDETNRLLGKQPRITVAPIDFSTMRILQPKDISPYELEGVKEAVTSRFTEGLRLRAARGGWRIGNLGEFVLRPRVTEYQPGWEVPPFAARPGIIRMTVVIATPDGVTLDELTVEGQGTADADMTPVGRSGMAAKAAGRSVGRFINDRIAGKL